MRCPATAVVAPLAAPSLLINWQREIFRLDVLNGQVAVNGSVFTGAFQLVPANDSIGTSQLYSFAEVANTASTRVLSSEL